SAAHAITIEGVGLRLRSRFMGGGSSLSAVACQATHAFSPPNLPIPPSFVGPSGQLRPAGGGPAERTAIHETLPLEILSVSSGYFRGISSRPKEEVGVTKRVVVACLVPVVGALVLATVSSGSPGRKSAAPLPASSCAPLVYKGSGSPKFVIASD